MLHISSGRLAAVAPNQRVWRIDSACRRQRLFRVVMAAGPSTDEATETDKGIDSSAPPQSRISSKRDMAFSVKDEVLGPTGKMPPDSEVRLVISRLPWLVLVKCVRLAVRSSSLQYALAASELCVLSCRPQLVATGALS